MYGSTEITTALGAVVPGGVTDDKSARPLLKAMTKAGLHVVLVERDGKRVVDMRTLTEKKKVAADTGVDVSQVPSGVYTSTDDLTALLKYTRRYVKPRDAKRTKNDPVPFGPGHVNFGVHIGASRLVVVDADYPAEVDAFVTWYALNVVGDADPRQVPGPTVRTPGTFNRDGGFDHRDGGHWYFTVGADLDFDTHTASSRTIVVDPAEVERVTGRSWSNTGAEKTRFTAKTGGTYVLVPPSLRPEGPYTLAMPDEPVPFALLAEFATVVAADDVYVPEYTNAGPTGEREPDVRVRSDEPGPAPERPADVVPGPTVTDEGTTAEVVGPSNGPLDEQLATWSEGTSWADVFAGTGWTPAGDDTSCGCPTWTRPHGPGERPTPKSLTAHDTGCSRGRTDMRHPSAHVWSDHLDDPLGVMVDKREAAGHPSARTLSKFAVYAALHHDGDMSAAGEDVGVDMNVSAYGIAAQDVSGQTVADRVEQTDVTRADLVGMRREDDTPYPVTDFVSPRPGVSAPVTTVDGRDMFESWGLSTPSNPASVPSSWPSFGPLSDFVDVDPPGWLVEDVLQLDGLNAVIGDSGSGKSAVMLDLLCTIAAGVGTWHGLKCSSFPVVYLAGEGFAGAVARMKAWQKVTGIDVTDRLFIIPEPVSLADDTGAWAAIAYYTRQVGAGLVVVDTFARVTTGLDENAAGDVGAAVGVLDRLKRTTGACVTVVHHTARGTTHGRGSTSLKGALDSEVFIEKVVDETSVLDDGSDPAGELIELRVTKQKNGRDDYRRYLSLTDRADAVHMAGPAPTEPTNELVVTDPEGRPSTYLATFASPAADVIRRDLPAVTDTADRVVEYVAGFTSTALTFSFILDGVRPPLNVDVDARRWKSHVLKAVDEALAETREPARRIAKVGAKYVAYSAVEYDEY